VVFDLIRKAIGVEGAAAPEEATAPGGLGRKIQVAACAVLLEAAYADYHCSEDELGHVVATMREIFGLEEDYARELVEMAHEEREQATDLYRFTRAINEGFTREEKAEVLEALWRVIYADGVIEKHEDALARKIVHLLGLERKEALDAKLRAKEQAGP
jgi:uncharacterized tellurite resistance protein B-like protein